MVALERRLQTNQVKTNMQVTKIRRKKGKLEVFSNGSSGSYEQIISTMPLLDLCKIVEDCPDEVVDAVRGLRINPMKIITFGFEGVDENQFTAVYVPSSEFSFNRVSYPGVFSPLNCPPGHHSIQVEITYPSDGTDYYESIDDEVAAKALSDLQQMNLAPHNPPIRTWVESFVHSYVVYESDYEERLSIARDYFESIGIYIHGRFGAHEYLNVDGCILRSIDLAQKLDSKITREELLSRLVESPLKDRES
jgi:protoporphyrinogen oxidase